MCGWGIQCSRIRGVKIIVLDLSKSIIDTKRQGRNVCLFSNFWGEISSILEFNTQPDYQLFLRTE